MLLVISHMLVLLVCWYYILEQRIDKITPVLHVVVVVVERKLFLASAVNLNHTVYFVSKHGIIIFLMMMLEKLIK